MFDEVTIRFILAVLVLLVGLSFLLGLFRFGTALFSGDGSKAFFSELHDFIMHFGPESRRFQWWADGLASAYQHHLEKRNDFWEHYGQMALAVLIVVVLAVLLLTKAISAEAGLPILSAVAGFAIAKTNSTSSSSVRRPEPPNRNNNE